MELLHCPFTCNVYIICLLFFFHSRRVGIPFSGPNVYKDSSNETHADMTVSVRGRDVFILQTGYR